MPSYRTIVVGNGPIGSAAGRYLAEWGHRVAILGQSEPPDAANHVGVFASHYDQGRLCSRLGRDPVWGSINGPAVDRYPDLESRSGIAFHRGVGWLRAARLTEPERDDLRAWIAEVSDHHRVPIRHFQPGDRSWRSIAPALDYPDSHDVIVEPGPAGWINPRQLVTAQNAIAVAHGATMVDALVVRVASGRDGVTVTTADGDEHTADRVIVSAGAFTNFNGLLPQPIPLRYKTESTIWADVSATTAAGLATMPVASYDIDDPAIDDIYLAPPIRYPDGVHRIKMGCNTADESWPTTLEEITTWFRGDGPDPQQPAMERALRSQLPDVALGQVTSHRCIVTYTPSGYPTIDVAPGDPHGRLVVASGGNGGGAQGSDTLGHLAAGLVHDGRWLDGLTREVFRATNHWSDSAAGRSKAQDRAMARNDDNR